MTPETSFERRSADWLDVSDALRRVLAAASPLPAEEIVLERALGRALAAEVRAGATLPAWDNSAMDGYAVRGDDIRGASPDAPVALRVSGVVRAGTDVRQTVEPGCAVRIMTGAPVPSGADTVVRVEDTDAEVEPGTVRVLDERDRGRHIRGSGRDMRAGHLLLPAGRTLTPGAIGVLAAAGRATAAVHRAPVVALLPTGDELRRVDRYQDVVRGLGVPESNTPMLAAMLRSIGAEPRPLPIATDDADEIRAGVEDAESTDALITIGGASMGEADLVKRVLDDMGFRQDFWRVKMRPGSPLSFGWLERGARLQPVFGLPGNPSSAFVTFEVFVRPFLLRLAGHRRVHRRTVRCVAVERFETPAELTYFQRVVLERRKGVTYAALTGEQTSGLVRGLATADGLAIVPPERSTVEEGATVDVTLLDDGLAVEEAAPT
jgi:molybdopterin molybdotransferase